MSETGFPLRSASFPAARARPVSSRRPGGGAETAHSLDGLYVYEWRAWDKFLIRDVAPTARPLPARIGDDGEAVLARLGDDARCLLFHLPLSRTRRLPLDRPRLRQALAERGIAVLNARVTDATKRAIQRHCRRLGLPCAAAPRDGDPDELLIVKSNDNYGAAYEKELTADERAFLGLDDPSGAPDATGYPVLPRREVPPGAYSDPTLSVERYIANRENAIYRVYVAGNRIVVGEYVSTATIKKGATTVKRRFWYESAAVSLSPGDGPDPTAGGPASRRLLVETVTRFAVGFGLDFGALDVARSDAGDYYVIDVNVTPWRISIHRTTEAQRRRIHSHIVAGLVSCLNPG